MGWKCWRFLVSRMNGLPLPGGNPNLGQREVSVQCTVGITMMHVAHGLKLAAIDLNLLVALKALLGERHVTRAARELGLSQSATSHALARLRELFGDPLLVR